MNIFWKSLHCATSTDFLSFLQTAEQAFRHILNIVDYSKYVMKPLLGDKYVHSGVSWRFMFFDVVSSRCLISSRESMNVMKLMTWLSTGGRQTTVGLCEAAVIEGPARTSWYEWSKIIFILYKGLGDEANPISSYCSVTVWSSSHAELRCDKVMDTFSGCGLCLPNLTQLPLHHLRDHRPPICVEIKVNLDSNQFVCVQVDTATAT